MSARITFKPLLLHSHIALRAIHTYIHTYIGKSMEQLLQHRRVFSVRSEVRIMKQKKLQLYITFHIFAVAAIQIVVFWVVPR
jgi:hypothetical protein